MRSSVLTLRDITSSAREQEVEIFSTYAARYYKQHKELTETLRIKSGRGRVYFDTRCTGDTMFEHDKRRTHSTMIAMKKKL